MKLAKHLLVAMSVCVLFAATASGQSTDSGGPYDYVEIDRFQVDQGVEFADKEVDEMMSYLVLHFNKSKRFDRVFLTTDAAAESAPARRAKVTGRVTKYAKGNRAARYLIGLGAGRTKLVADVLVTDAQTGQILFEHRADGHVYGGFFGGETDTAKSNLASEIIKTMTKKGYASKNRKK